jgi:hypothetical protein
MPQTCRETDSNIARQDFLPFYGTHIQYSANFVSSSVCPVNVTFIVQFNYIDKYTALFKVTTGCVEQRVSIVVPKDTKFRTTSNNVNNFVSTPQSEST